ncbi:6-bladed beta-propeller [Rhodocaloribacter sp.]
MSSKKNLLRTALVTFILCASTACKDAGITHPSIEHIPFYARVDHVIDVSTTASSERGLHELAQRLRRAKVKHSIGVAEGSQEEMIARVEDLAVNDNNGLLLLDSRYNEVRFFDLEGRLIHVLGGPGKGPEEFEAPAALLLSPERRLIVADRKYRLKIFEPKDPGYSYDKTIILPSAPNDICALNDNLYIQQFSRKSNTTIDVLSPTGEVLFSFGETYQTNNWVVKLHFARGKVACFPSEQTVVVGYELLPLLYGYAPDGTLKWVTRLKDFTPPSVQERTYKGRPAASLKRSGTTDLLLQITPIAEGYFLVQTGRTNHGIMNSFLPEGRTIHTYLLSAETGNGTYLGNDFPSYLKGARPIIYAATSNRLYAAVDTPFPTVIVYTF